MGYFGTFWDVVGCFGTFWIIEDVLLCFGMIWGVLGVFFDVFRMFWAVLERIGMF